MSPRAAWRLETLGFTDVRDYAGGKADWLAAGEPVEGHAAGVPPLVELVDREAVRCGLDEPLGGIRERLGDRPFAVAVDGRGVVLGKVRARDLDDGEVAADVLVEGPTTVRADEDPDGLRQRMERARTGSVLVTTGQGELLGVFRG